MNNPHFRSSDYAEVNMAGFDENFPHYYYQPRYPETITEEIV